MDVTEIHGSLAAPPVFMTRLGQLIEAVGRVHFGRALFETARAATGCEQLIAFVEHPGKPPRTTIFENRGHIPRRLNDKYTTHYWRDDPIRVLGRDAGCRHPCLARVDARRLQSLSYRDDCFVDVGLRSRATSARMDDGKLVQLSLYFTDDRAFGADVADYMAATAPIVDALLRRHHDEATGGGEPANSLPRLDEDAISDRIRRAAPKLTDRELQVCTHIARGLTSEGIALELGVSLNTVLTYRKRAYARLNITTQNELMHMMVA